MSTPIATPVWLAAGVRTPFAKVDGALASLDAIALSVPVVRHMIAQLRGATPDFAAWGAVVPNLTWSNVAREVLMDAGVAPTIPAFSTVMACSTSMIGVIEAAGMLNDANRSLALVGGVESLSGVQLGLGQSLSNWIRRFQQARSLGQKVSHVTDLKLGDVRLYIPAVSNRTTGKSMGEHTEITARDWNIARAAQDEIALASHQRAVAAWARGFFDDLVIPVGKRDARHDSARRHLAREARGAPALVRPHQRARHADGGQFLAAHGRRRRAVGGHRVGTRPAAGRRAARAARRLGDHGDRPRDRRPADGARVRRFPDSWRGMASRTLTSTSGKSTRRSPRRCRRTSRRSRTRHSCAARRV